MKLLIVLLTSIFSFTSFSQGLVSPIVEEMHKVFEEGEHKKLRSGKFILRKKNINKSAWPELTFYTVIDADPLHCMAIFAAFEHQKNYVPGMKESSVINQKSPTEAIVKYVLDMPWPLSDSVYVHGHKLKQLDSDTYQLDWYMIESDAADIVKGRAEFYPFEGKTLFKYKSFVNPKNILAGLLKNTMISDVKASLIATKNEAMKLKGKKSSKEFIEKITTALSGKFPYPNAPMAK